MSELQPGQVLNLTGTGHNPNRDAEQDKAPSGHHSYFLYAVRGARIENFGQLISSARCGYTRGAGILG